MGLTILPTVISLSRTLARLAIGLDKQPELTAGLTQRGQSASGEDGPERITLVEGRYLRSNHAFSPHCPEDV